MLRKQTNKTSCFNYNQGNGVNKKENMENSGIAWHRSQSEVARVEEELMQMSSEILSTETDPVERLRLLCLSQGCSGILGIGRILRRMDHDGSKQLNKKQFFKGLQVTGLELNNDDAEQLFQKFDADNSGSISIDELIKKIRPPMSDCRQAIVEQAFKKLDKTGDGVITLKDIREVYAVQSHHLYQTGEETADVILDRFLNSFETSGVPDETITLEEFMNYYSGISVSIDYDCYFDLMMRQSYKL